MSRDIKLIASREFIIDLIEAGSLDNLDDLEQMPDEEYEKTIKYWQENFFNDGDYSQQELKEYYNNNHHGVVFKIESKENSVPKTELVTVLNEKNHLISVKSITDGYCYSYSDWYFNENKKPATMEDIENYKFEINSKKEENIFPFSALKTSDIEIIKKALETGDKYLTTYCETFDHYVRSDRVLEQMKADRNPDYEIELGLKKDSDLLLYAQKIIERIQIKDYAMGTVLPQLEEDFSLGYIDSNEFNILIKKENLMKLSEDTFNKLTEDMPLDQELDILSKNVSNMLIEIKKEDMIKEIQESEEDENER